MKILSYFACFIIILCYGCNSNSTSPTGGNIVNLWVSSYKDTYVSCGGNSGGTCREGESNYGNVGYLTEGYNTAQGDYKRIYIEFLFPNLPSGSEIKKAYLEVFHGGKNEDGTTDNITVSGNLAVQEWDPMTLTMNNCGPTFASGQGPGFNIQVRSQNWCGSHLITNIVRDIYNDVSSHHGFVLYPLQVDHQKGFNSNNHQSRTSRDLGTAPRLLLQVELPSGSTVNDITMPALPNDNDLGFAPGTQILMLRFRTGDDWPADWNVVGR